MSWLYRSETKLKEFEVENSWLEELSSVSDLRPYVCVQKLIRREFIFLCKCFHEDQDNGSPTNLNQSVSSFYGATHVNVTVEVSPILF